MTVHDLKDLVATKPSRMSTTWDEMDWLYGRPGEYGLPKGMISLWAGESGVGKTRLLVEMMKRLDQQGLTSLIFQGEVTPEQFKGEKMENYVEKTHIWVSPDVTIDEQIAVIEKLQPDLVITDSVQQIEEYRNGRGAKEIVRKLRNALSYGGHLILISQMTGQKSPRGGTTLPHEVDTVCYVERGITTSLFTISCKDKNRYGKVGNKAVFAHKDWGVECQSNYRFEDNDWVESHPVTPKRRSWLSRLLSLFL